MGESVQPVTVAVKLLLCRSLQYCDVRRVHPCMVPPYRRKKGTDRGALQRQVLIKGCAAQTYPYGMPRGLGLEGRDIQGFLPGVTGTLNCYWTLAFALYRERISGAKGGGD